MDVGILRPMSINISVEASVKRINRFWEKLIISVNIVFSEYVYNFDIIGKRGIMHKINANMILS